MEDDNLADIILQAAYRIPSYISVQKNIFAPLNMESDIKQIMFAQKRLALEGLIEEKDPDSTNSLIKITPKGYYAIEMFETYKSYRKEQKKLALSQHEILFLKERNIRLKNLNIIVGTIFFILGILLSTPIKNILKQWLVSY